MPTLIPSPTAAAMTSALKPAKPVVFDGMDVMHVTVHNWMFSIQEYMDLAEIPEAKQTRLAGTYLSGIAKSWYINKYADASPLPTLNVFLANFKKHHTRSDNAVTVIRRIETMRQGRNRPAADYGTEFESLVAELGTGADPHWIHEHFLRGLNDATCIALAPALNREEDLDTLITRANNVSRALEQARPRVGYTRSSHNPSATSASRPALKRLTD
jgi:hypothetical protein